MPFITCLLRIPNLKFPHLDNRVIIVFTSESCHEDKVKWSVPQGAWYIEATTKCSQSLSLLVIDITVIFVFFRSEQKHLLCSKSSLTHLEVLVIPPLCSYMPNYSTILHQFRNWWNFHILASLTLGSLVSSMTCHGLIGSIFCFLVVLRIMVFLMSGILDDTYTHDNGHKNLIIQSG